MPSTTFNDIQQLSTISKRSFNLKAAFNNFQRYQKEVSISKPPSTTFNDIQQLSTTFK